MHMLSWNVWSKYNECPSQVPCCTARWIHSDLVPLVTAVTTGRKSPAIQQSDALMSSLVQSSVPCNAMRDTKRCMHGFVRSEVTMTEVEESMSYAHLPADALLFCFRKLEYRDHLSAGVACKSWQAVADGLWRSRCVDKWKLGESWPADSASDQEWKSYYQLRHLVRLRQLLVFPCMCQSPTRLYLAVGCPSHGSPE